MTLSRFLKSLACGVAATVLLIAPLRAQDAAEMLLRLDRLEQLVRQLTGQLEQAQNQNRGWRSRSAASRTTRISASRS